MQITSRTGSPTSIKPYGAGGERKPLTRQEVFDSGPTHNVKRIWRSGQQRGHRVTCYHPARVGTGKSDPVLSRVEPVAHVSRQLGRVKVTRRPVLAGERDVSVSRALRVGDPDLASPHGCRPAVPKPRPPPGVRQPVDVTGPWAIAATPFYPFNATVGFRLLGPSSSPMVTDGCGCP